MMQSRTRRPLSAGAFFISDETSRRKSVKRLRCRECGRLRDFEPAYVCDHCFGPLEVAYDFDEVRELVSRESIARGPDTIWRYRELLPAPEGEPIDLGTGFTSLVKARNLGKELGLDHLYLKNDTVNPTGSVKDRNVAVATNFALSYGFDTLSCSSTGNLAGSVAAYAARAGMRSLVFIPVDLEPGKVGAASAYGATVVEVNGTYDDVNRLCVELADLYGWAIVNVNLRPFYSEGSKTLAFEVVEQLGWRAPDHLVVPVAAGALLRQDGEGLPGTGWRWPSRPGRNANPRGPGARLRAGQHGRSARTRPHHPSATEQYRQVARDREPGRWTLRRPRRAGLRWVGHRLSRGVGPGWHGVTRRDRGHPERAGRRGGGRRPAGAGRRRPGSPRRDRGHLHHRQRIENN